MLPELYSDTYTDSLDSVVAPISEQARDEACLIKMILCLQAPVLSMPQMFDSVHTLRLAQNKDFQTIIQEGIIRTSLFGNYNSLKEYVLHCLKQPGYLFSSLSCLNPKGSQLKEEDIQDIKNRLGQRLENNSNSDKKYPYPDSVRGYDKIELFHFVEGVLALNEAMKPEDYRRNLESSTSMSEMTKTNLDTLKQNFGENDPHVVILEKLLGELDTEKGSENRSHYRNRLSQWEQNKLIDPRANIILTEVIDLSYNQYMAPRIARDARLDANESNPYTSCLLERSEKSWNQALNEARADYVYNELCEEISHGSGPSDTCVDWKTLVDIVQQTKRKLHNENASPREEIMKEIYKDYYSDKILREKYQIPVELTSTCNPRIPSMYIETIEKNEKEKQKRKKVEEVKTRHENSEKVKETFTHKVRVN